MTTDAPLHVPKPLVLASASPRRVELLRSLAPQFIVDPAALDEAGIIQKLAGQPAYAIAEALAYGKAVTVAERHPDQLLLAADTLVVLREEILGKPTDAADAARILWKLSGTTHDVITAVCLGDPAQGRDGLWLVRSARAAVTMRTLTTAEIEAYVKTGESFGKAGAYAIQEHGDRFVSRLDGDFDTVVGLPLKLVRALFEEWHAHVQP